LLKVFARLINPSPYRFVWPGKGVEIVASLAPRRGSRGANRSNWAPQLPRCPQRSELIHPMNRAGNSASGRLSRKRLQENAIRIPSQRRTGRLVLKLLGRKLITNNSAFTGYRRYQVLSNSLWCLRLMSGADVGDDALEGAPAPCAHGWATSARPVSRINRTLTLLP